MLLRKTGKIARGLQVLKTGARIFFFAILATRVCAGQWQVQSSALGMKAIGLIERSGISWEF